MYIADLHIHSSYSRATSRDCDLPHLDLAARNKGILLVGTGDFTHPAWRAAMREQLVPAEEGLYMLRREFRLPAEAAGADEPARFLVTGEISTIYKKGGRTRKVHSLILLPGLSAADALAQRLDAIGNIRSDGRPILGLDCEDLLEITLDTCPEAMFIPAHIWTPHFSLFGAFSGFDTIEECFGGLAGEIHALETGLSSDPPMNWRVSALDRFTLVSNSDAHSPAKLGREANCIEAPLSYPALRHALQTGEGFQGTIEFFPEEGKYHLDGHRNCGVRLEPEETLRLGGKCPVCGRKLTIGVQHRVLALADRAEGFLPPDRKPYESLVPLPELIAAAMGMSAAGQKAQRQYEALLRALGPEFYILREAPLAEIERAAGPCIAEGVRRLRAGQVARTGGYDGEYGKITLFSPEERAALQGQLSLFGAAAPEAPAQKKPAAALPAEPARAQASTPEAPRADAFNAEQRSAVETEEPAVAVIAGPGTGKTKTLVARIAYLIETRGAKPAEITAVTFTNQAAAEMRERLAARLGGKQALAGMTIGTFHAVCLGLLPPKPLLGEAEAELLVQEALGAAGSSASVRDAQRAISRVKNGASLEEAALDPRVYEAYCAACRALGARDLDDLLLEALDAAENEPAGKRKRARFRHLLVDEFQDINAVQRKLVRAWAKGGESLFVIGDPDQSIYGFRGASAVCFDELRADFPALSTIRLRTNYRSTPEILACARQAIARNPGGPRELLPARPGGAAVRLLRAETPFAEGVWIAKEIARMAGGLDMLSAHARAGNRQEDARPFSDLAVLCRTHRQLEAVEACLRHDDIPCIVSGRGSELADGAVQGALAFFRFLLNPADALSLRACLRLAFGCTDVDAARVSASTPRLSTPGASPGTFSPEALRAAGCPEAFLSACADFLPRTAHEKPRKLVERYQAEYAPDAPALTRLAELAAYYADMAGFLHALALGEEADLRRAAGKAYSSGAVRLMTLHGAKGLEFPVVFLAGLSAGAFPLEREGMVSDLEEERRLFFVGMTRARDELILTAPNPPSEFLRELPDSILRETARRRHAEQGKQLTLF